MSSTYCKKVSLHRLRQVNAKDYDSICYKLQQAIDSIVDPYLARKCTAEYAATRVIEGDVDSVILDDTYLVCYTIGSPWYSDKTILMEQLVLKIGNNPDSKFSHVCDLFDDMRDYYGADEILVSGGLSSRPDLLAKKYEDNGFTKLEYPSLIKRR